MRGIGVDVADYREYQPGDDVRRIDWRLSSRQPWVEDPRLIVREYYEERSLDSLVVVDASRSMLSGGKLSAAVYTSTLITHVLLRLGDRVSVVVVGCGGRREVVLKKPQQALVIADIACHQCTDCDDNKREMKRKTGNFVL
jgi:uncharacterized protein (DUF58 family)